MELCHTLFVDLLESAGYGENFKLIESRFSLFPRKILLSKNLKIKILKTKQLACS